MRILALDCSTKSTGYAVMDSEDKIVKYGCLTESSADVIKRIHNIKDSIDKIIKEFNPEKLIVEEVLPDAGHKKNPTVWKALTMLQADIRFLLHDKYDNEIDIEFLYPSQWRSKLNIPNGKNIKRTSAKEFDKAYVKESFDIIANDDICDAICIGCSYFVADKESGEINWES